MDFIIDKQFTQHVFLWEHGSKEFVLDLVPSIAITMVIMALILVFSLLLLLICMEMLLKSILWHFSCCHKVFYLAYQRLHENRAHVDLSLKMYYISNALYDDPDTGSPIWPLNMWYQTTPISWNSTGIILMTYDENGTIISNPRTPVNDLFSWGTFTNIFPVYLVLWIKIHIHACV